MHRGRVEIGGGGRKRNLRGEPNVGAGTSSEARDGPIKFAGFRTAIKHMPFEEATE
jgi:hypothetical protein